MNCLHRNIRIGICTLVALAFGGCAKKVHTFVVAVNSAAPPDFVIDGKHYPATMESLLRHAHDLRGCKISVQYDPHMAYEDRLDFYSTLRDAGCEIQEFWIPQNSRFDLPPYLDHAVGLEKEYLESKAQRSSNAANKSVESTPTAVTPAADAPGAPPAGVPHH